MKMPSAVTLREILPADLDVFFAHQLDPEANRMAAFVGKDPSDRAVFDDRWQRILASTRNVNRTILVDGRIAGHIAIFPMGDDREVTYWLGREFWGHGIATEALRQMLRAVPIRPIRGRAAADHVASIRVLQKCGFRLIGHDRGFATGRGAEIDEVILQRDEAN